MKKLSSVRGPSTIGALAGSIRVAIEAFVVKRIGAELPWFLVGPGIHPLKYTHKDLPASDDGEDAHQAYTTITCKKAWGEGTTVTMNFIEYAEGFGWLADGQVTITYGPQYPVQGLRGKQMRRRIRPILTRKDGALIPVKYAIESLYPSRSRHE